MMSLRSYFLVLLLSVSILGCSHLIPEKRQDVQDATLAPECKKNQSKEGNFFSGTRYKTWVKYDNLDFDKAFDAALFSLQNHGHRVVSYDRGLGTILGQAVSGTAQQTSYPVDVNITREETSLIVNLRFKATGEDRDQAMLCSFYEEFEKLAKDDPLASPQARTPVRTPKPVQPPPVKSQDPDQPVAPPVESKSRPAQPPPPSPLSAPLRVTEVVWALVNLREGPGMNYKVVGTAKKGASLKIFEEKGGWLRVVVTDGKEVWVSKSATSEAPKPSPPSGPPPAPSPSPSSPSSPTPKKGPSKPVSPM